MDEQLERQPTHRARTQQNPSGIRLFLRTLFRTIVGMFAFIGLWVTLVPILLIILFWGSRSGDTSSKAIVVEKPLPPLVVELNLRGVLVESEGSLEDQLIKRIFGIDNEISVHKLRTTLRRIKGDPDVSGVAIELGPLEATSSQLVGIRRQLEDIKAAGKKVYVWSAGLETYGYHLASVADEIHLAPAGGMSITGPVFTLTYFGSALRKLGVDFEVIKSGKYKNAFEPFIANKPSTESLAVYNSMEQSLLGMLVQDVAAGRSQDVERVRSWFEQSLFVPDAAVEEGLVDKVSFYDEFEDAITAPADKNSNSSTLLSMNDYLAATSAIDDKITSSGKYGLGLIEARGQITDSAHAGSEEQSITPMNLRKEIEWALSEDDVKAVVLRIDSPGGSATASDIIWHDLKRLAEKKPLVVSMANVAASGGYYMAVAGQRILAEPTTITGSIGVIGAVPNFSAFEEKYGVSFHVVTSSERKELLNPGEKASAFDKAIVENSIEEAYKLFLERVADGRKMSVDEVHELAQGRVYTGLEASSIGLIDDLGGVNEAFNAAKELGGLEVEKLYPIMRYQGESESLTECLKSVTKLFQCIRKLDSGVLLQSVQKQVWDSTVRPDLKIAHQVRRVFDRKEYVFAWWPYSLAVSWR